MYYLPNILLSAATLDGEVANFTQKDGRSQWLAACIAARTGFARIGQFGQGVFVGLLRIRQRVMFVR